MNESAKWLREFAARAERTDRFVGRSDHRALLAAGLWGESGSIISELKKQRREREAYPIYRQRMFEEIGDFLWYYVRLVSLCDPVLLEAFVEPTCLFGAAAAENVVLHGHLQFGVAGGAIV